MSQEQEQKPPIQKPASTAIQALQRQAAALQGQERFAEAERIYQEILRQEPANFDALHLLGVIALRSGRTQRGAELIASAIAVNPNIAAAYVNMGSALATLRRHEQALASYDKAIALRPDFAEAYCNRGITLNNLKRHEHALADYDKAIALRPDFAEAFCNRGNALNGLGHPAQAVESCDRAIALKPDFAEAFCNRGNALNALRRYAQALASCDKAIALNPHFAAAHYNRGNALNEIKRYDDALAAYDRALASEPDLAGAWLGRGDICLKLKRYDEALSAYDHALTSEPDSAAARLGRGNVFLRLKRYDDALASYDEALAIDPALAAAWLGRGNVFYVGKSREQALAAYERALALNPEFAEAWLGRGNILAALDRNDKAFAAYDKALALRPDLAEAWLSRGKLCNRVKQHEAAAAAYAEVLKIDPQHPFVKGMLLHQKMLSCDWLGTDALIAEVERDIAAGKLSAEPFGWQGVARSQRSMQICAELFSKNSFPADIRFSPQPPPAGHKKIRIGYSSGELRAQATSQLIVGVIELHDKSRFEIYGIDNGWGDKSGIRRRIEASVDRMIDISDLSDAAAAATIHDNRIDILVNLNGYFGEHRMRVFAQRPAPIQVNYLGFPGTLGASYMDYIIADRHVVPESHKQFCIEKIAYLPDCYQANDRKKEIGTRHFSRPECGLPQNGFVFCCFNNNYKIMPELFDRWMRILKQVEGSVLWLFEDNANAAANLRKEAAARGVNSERLVFAPRMALPDHLARHRLADLFLDTTPCNAHTTASDALWAGLPLLTQIGETFSGRVAASLLMAIGLPELVTSTPQVYDALAVELATNPQKLAQIKDRLAQNRLTTPLFDGKLFTRHLETAYASMYERYRAGLPPDHIDVQPEISPRSTLHR